MKNCSRCSTRKDGADFSRDASRKDGLAAWCRTCIRTYRKNRPSGGAGAKYATGADAYREAKRYRKFGITACEYARMRIEQADRCAICGNPPGRKALAIDHCHDTGAVRALLCHPCNTGIGLFRESVETLTAAIAYLQR